MCESALKFRSEGRAGGEVVEFGVVAWDGEELSVFGDGELRKRLSRKLCTEVAEADDVCLERILPSNEGFLNLLQ